MIHNFSFDAESLSIYPSATVTLTETSGIKTHACLHVHASIFTQNNNSDIIYLNNYYNDINYVYIIYIYLHTQCC